ncbi:Uncharacterised protein [Segatella copri]|nr:Uncharacterised protein [Segatella copri]
MARVENSMLLLLVKDSAKLVQAYFTLALSL